MKLFKKHIHVAATFFVAATLVFTTSCTKESDNLATGTPEQSEAKAVTNKHTQEDIQELVDRLPPVAWYNSTMDKVIIFDPLNDSKSFDFSDPYTGWDFSNTTAGIEFVDNPAGGGVLFVTPGAFGASGAGTGTVVAGNTSLDIDYAMCLSADEEFLGFGSEVSELGFDGLSMIIGISGNFEALTTENFDEEDDDAGTLDITSFFNGIAAYLVYDDQAQGDYQILSYIDEVDGEEDASTLEGSAFSVVAGFTSNSISIYFSKDGSLNVSGGSMDFNGNYYGMVLEGLPTMDDSEDVLNMSYEEVPGFGQMGCM